MTATTTMATSDPLRCSILRRVAPVLRATGVDDHEMGCRLEGSTADPHVVLIGPGACRAVRDALGVRVLDAVRADGRTFGTVSVETSFG